MKFSIIIVWFILALSTAIAQRRSIIVCDSLSKEPLPHVALYIGSRPMLTNEKGCFTVYNTSDSLVIEVPFKNRQQYIPYFSFKDTILINAAIYLEPITIVSGKSVLEKVLENISRNYNTNRHFNFNSFVRASTIHNGKYIHFQEIVTRSYLPYEMAPIGTRGKGIGTVIKGMRSSNITSKEYQFNSLALFPCLTFGVNIEQLQSYTFEAVESYAEGWKFSYDFSRNNFQYKGWFLINKRDYALTEINGKVIQKNADTYQKNRIKLPMIHTFHLIYDKQKGAPYYSRKYSRLYQEYFLSNKEKTKLDSLIITFDLFNYEYGYENPEKIKPVKNTLLTPVNLLKFPYDKFFWLNYKPFELTPIQKELLMELENKKPFED